MDTQKRLHENISALADGELADSERELALAALDAAEGRAAWRAYHLTGDVLRDQANGELSDGFSASLAARLAAEPAYLPDAAPAGRAADPLEPDPAESPADVILP
ncbi:sigma-E factor negative regulatory protein [Duganella violaceipulchra]|uniref:Sigma-E factor negative regulatory protein n=1 Tax=Duganella violaceipulchra TaxID=2849652 RepID=A0AA41HCX7_9BURK|nr:sigma-E factor negative regulatory protein [Duganella violaceicalia]MBV6325019.1 sigma-E factor negative regulatory protein [Duganella violaceicalia]MCP2009198.1 sigma-E factor negative regulatory protein RseA [Duganella violaceicalia]